MKYHASFVVAMTPSGLIAATTRPGGGIGLPGGKVEGDETPWEAAVREAAEEGWGVTVVSRRPIHTQLVEGKMVAWFAAANPRRLSYYKEMDRGILPVEAAMQEIADSGFGNENLGLVGLRCTALA